MTGVIYKGLQKSLHVTKTLEKRKKVLLTGMDICLQGLFCVHGRIFRTGNKCAALWKYVA